MLNFFLLTIHDGRQIMQIYGKKLQNKSKKEMYVINGTPSR